MPLAFDLVTLDSPSPDDLAKFWSAVLGMVETERLAVLGATRLGPPRHEAYGSILNLADPDGNPFDLCAYS